MDYQDEIHGGKVNKKLPILFGSDAIVHRKNKNTSQASSFIMMAKELLEEEGWNNSSFVAGIEEGFAASKSWPTLESGGSWRMVDKTTPLDGYPSSDFFEEVALNGFTCGKCKEKIWYENRLKCYYCPNKHQMTKWGWR